MKKLLTICLVAIVMMSLNGCSTLYAVADTIETICYSVENIEYNINRTKRSFERMGESFKQSEYHGRHHGKHHYKGGRRCSFDDMEQTIPQDSLYYLELEPVYFPE